MRMRVGCAGAKPRSYPLLECVWTPPTRQQAHYGNKRSLTWTGYKVHLTETCDDDEVHLITHVETTPAGVTDSELAAPIHQALANNALLPAEHLMDAGYVDADLLVKSQRDLGIEV